MKVFLASGEVSGDAIAASLARRLRQIEPSVRLFGLGGERTRAAGVEVDADVTHLGTVGISEAFAVAWPLLRTLNVVRRRVRSERPDVAVLVGNDVYSVLLARVLRAHGIPTVSLFPPQVWIWRPIARLIARSFDLMLCGFPEEQVVYRAAGGDVRFVGHHLAEALVPPVAEERDAVRARLMPGAAGPVVCLLPGSRTHEVRALCGVLLDAAAELAAGEAAIRFLLPVADRHCEQMIRRELGRRELSGVVRLVHDSQDALRASDVAVGASGTATLEAGLLGVPMVVTYRVAPLTLAVVRTSLALGLLRSDVIALPNLLLGCPVLPEVKQRRLRPAAVAAEVRRFLDDEGARREVQARLAALREMLHVPDGVGRAAEAVLRLAAAGGPAPAPVSDGRVIAAGVKE